MKDVAAAARRPAALGLARAVRAGMPVILGIVLSWLVAVALLTAALHWLPVTPGFMPDHIE